MKRGHCKASAVCTTVKTFVGRNSRRVMNSAGMGGLYWRSMLNVGMGDRKEHAHKAARGIVDPLSIYPPHADGM